MAAKSHQRPHRDNEEEIARTVKRLVNRTMGTGFREPDPQGGKALLEMVEKADRDDDERVFAALAKPGVNDVILWAAEQGHIKLVKRLLEAGVSAKHTSMGLRPINMAAKEGRTDVVEFLLDAGEDPSYAEFLSKPVVIEAAEKGHVETVKTLVRRGAGVSAKEELGGKTVLLAIAPKADTEVVRLIVDKGADINAADDEGQTALMRAAEAGNVEGARELIRLGANVNCASRLRSAEAIEAEGRGELFSFGNALRKIRAARKDPLQTALMFAAANGHAETAEALLQGGADVNARDAAGQTAIEYATVNGHATVLRVLSGGRAAGTPEVGIRDLLRAAEEGNVDALHAALRAGVDVNGKITVRYEGDINEGFTPLGGKPALVLAAERDDLAMAKVLLEAGADPNLCAEATLFDNGQNALHAAAARGNIGLVKTLLAAGAGPNAKEIGRRDVPARTALQLATENGHAEVVQELLKTERTGGKKVKASGLHEAAGQGNEQLVRLLLDQGTDVEALSRAERWTPLMLASFGAFPRVVDQLLEAGANINATNKSGQTALSVAVHGAWLRWDWEGKEKRSQETLETIHLLIKRGANVNVDSWDDQTPLDMAIESGLRKIAAVLREAGGKRAKQLH